MRAQVYMIALLVSLLIWSTSFLAVRESYRFAHSSGLIPNLHLYERLDSWLEG